MRIALAAGATAMNAARPGVAPSVRTAGEYQAPRAASPSSVRLADICSRIASCIFALPRVRRRGEYQLPSEAISAVADWPAALSCAAWIAAPWTVRSASSSDGIGRRVGGAILRTLSRLE